VFPSQASREAAFVMKMASGNGSTHNSHIGSSHGIEQRNSVSSQIDKPKLHSVFKTKRRSTAHVGEPPDLRLVLSNSKSVTARKESITESAYSSASGVEPKPFERISKEKASTSRDTCSNRIEHKPPNSASHRKTVAGGENLSKSIIEKGDKQFNAKGTIRGKSKTHSKRKFQVANNKASPVRRKSFNPLCALAAGNAESIQNLRPKTVGDRTTPKLVKESTENQSNSKFIEATSLADDKAIVLNWDQPSKIIWKQLFEKGDSAESANSTNAVSSRIYDLAGNPSHTGGTAGSIRSKFVASDCIKSTVKPFSLASKHCTTPSERRCSIGSTWKTPESLRVALSAATFNLSNDEKSFLNSSFEDSSEDLLVSPERTIKYEISNINTLKHRLSGPERSLADDFAQTNGVHSSVAKSLDSCPGRMQESKDFACLFSTTQFHANAVKTASKQCKPVKYLPRNSVALKLTKSRSSVAKRKRQKFVANPEIWALTPPPKAGQILLSSPSAIFLSPKLRTRFHDIEDTADIPMLEFTIIRLESQISDFQEQIQSKNTRIFALEEECLELRSKIETESQQVVSINAQAEIQEQATDSEIRHGEQKKTSLVKHDQDIITNIFVENKTLTEQEQLKKELGLFQQELNRMNLDFDLVKIEDGDFNQTLHAERTKICDKVKELDYDIKDNPEQNERNTQLEHKLRCIQDELQCTITQLTKCTSENKVLIQKLREQEDLVEKETSQRQSSLMCISEMTSELTKCTSENEVLRQKLREQKDLVEKETSQRQISLMSISEMSAELTKCTSENKVLIKKLREHEDLVEKETSQRQSSLMSISELSAELTKCTSENKALRQKLREQEDLVEKETSQRQSSLMSISEMSADLNNLHSELGFALEECLRLTSENEELQIEIAHREEEWISRFAFQKEEFEHQLCLIRERVLQLSNEHKTFMSTTTNKLLVADHSMRNAHHQIIDYVKEEIAISTESLVEIMNSNQEQHKSFQQLKDRFVEKKVQKLEAELCDARTLSGKSENGSTISSEVFQYAGVQERTPKSSQPSEPSYIPHDSPTAVMSPLPTMESWKDFSTRFRLALEGKLQSPSYRGSPKTPPPSPCSPCDSQPFLYHSFGRCRSFSNISETTKRGMSQPSDKEFPVNGIQLTPKGYRKMKDFMSELSFERTGTPFDTLLPPRKHETVNFVKVLPHHIVYSERRPSLSGDSFSHGLSLCCPNDKKSKKSKPKWFVNETEDDNSIFQDALETH